MRIAVASLVLMALFFASLLSIVFSQAATDDWSMFHHDASHTGYSTSTAPTTNETLWNFTINGTSTAPSVADGKLYVACSEDSSIYCLDATTGALIWKCATGGEPSSLEYALGAWPFTSPTVYDGRVYVCPIESAVYCIDASSGNMVWKYTTNGTTGSAPTVFEGKVYFGSDDQYIYCLDAAEGNLIWNQPTGHYVRSSPAVADGKVYVGTQGGDVYCLDAGNGDVKWKFATGGIVFSSPAVTSDNVYVGSDDGNVYCLSAADGAVIWKYLTAAGVYSSPALFEGKVYVGSHDNNIYCLDASNGNLIWKYSTGSEAGDSPAVADGKVYFGSWENDIYCLDALNGGLVWKYSMEGEFWSSAIVAEGNVYVTGETPGQIIAFGVGEASGPSPSTSGSSGSPTSEYVAEVAELYTVPWVPPAETAAAAAAVTATVVGIAATVQASLSNQVGAQSGKVAEKLVDLLPDGFKRWLEEFVSSKRKARVFQKTAPALLPTKAEVLAYCVSLLVLTISFSYVKVNDITQVLYVLPTVLVTAVIVEFAKTFSQVVVARILGVWTEHKLWYFGLVMLLVSTFIFGIPFSAPTRNVYYTPKLTKRLNAVVACLAILVTLAFGVLFFGLLISGFTLIGSTGLAMCIIMGFIDTFPLEPLNGKAIYQHNKAAWAAFFVFTLTIYVSWLLFF